MEVKWEINLTKDLVPGTMYQVTGEKEYSVNEQIGLPENAKFTDVIDYWGKNLPEEEIAAYFDFLKISNLIEHYQKGETHVFVSHIFEAFTHEETSTVSGIQGTGLGGTEFEVSLMFKLCGETVAYEKLEHLQGLNVLVADDDVDTCLNISSMLKEIGMRAEWTVSGKEAVIRTKHALDLGG